MAVKNPGFKSAYTSHEGSECKPGRATQSRKDGSGIAKRIPRGLALKRSLAGYVSRITLPPI
jgi:hypothetical protein